MAFPNPLPLATLLLSALLLISCAETPKETAPASPTQPAAPEADRSAVPAPERAPMQERPLRVEPVKGFAGETFSIAAAGMPPGRTVEFQWATWEGSYATQVDGDSVLFQERSYKEVRFPLGQAAIDAQGRGSASFSVPEDFGELHNIYGVVDGQDVARGGFRVLRSAEISPAEGPVGTAITITMKGLGWKPFESTAAVRYDNAYTGFVSGVTTRGSATFQVRAAGPAGRHTIQLTTASPGVPFLNNQESGTAYIPNMDMRFTFAVTEDSLPPDERVEWPEGAAVAREADAIPKVRVQPGVNARLQPAAGPSLSRPNLEASGLPPETEVEIRWIAGRGGDGGGALQSLGELPLGKAVAGRDGSLNTSFQVPDKWGGWQLVKLVGGGSVLAELPFYVEWSLAGVNPKQVKAGEQFTVQIKGGGWTELDKGVAVTYDNSYIGYACSATSGGDITLNLVATGAPGTHLIDLYPMVYRDTRGAHAPESWNFELPQLTALHDHPGLSMGYRLPIIRLAVTVVP